DDARALDARLRAGGRAGPLAGVPVAVKDNLCLARGRTTCASRMLEAYESPFTATAVQRLIDAGAVVVGKTNLDEFAMGSSCEFSIFGPTRNPWDDSRVPGGSSGGSAAAVAAGLVPLALGSDTGGSIRQPAGFCGVAGLKPTYGRISRWGLVAFASSLDQVGPFARTVGDCALALSIMAGRDALDATCCDRPPEDFAARLGEPVRPLRIAIPRQARGGGVEGGGGNHAAVDAALDAAAAALAERGAEIVEIDLPHAEHAVAAYYIVAAAEASSNLARFDGVRYGRRAAMREGDSLEDLYRRSRTEGFGEEVRRRILLGTHVLSSGYQDKYYLTALKARRRIKDDFDRAFEAGASAVLMPTSPAPPFRLGEKTEDPLALYLEDVYTVGVNLAGLPAIALPAGVATLDGRTLPVGVQLIAPAFGEARLLRIAHELQAALAFNARHAPDEPRP
ncbi:MAG TPA: Asp-tRNA(Asn)/Glu-tRNA(Gln) amidotransferase subunit GatA, partial [Phycisphaerales bacterium]|nr:Asp-tRNA(Asn)/Glu-tRNA(Gln) amidotransferase subunit GatA [Phycisphaerales bacterium]